MTGPYYLAGDGMTESLDVATRPQIPTLVLESLDGSVRIPLDGTAGWVRMPGSTGLEMPPVEIITQSIPGVPGSTLADVRIDQRPIFIPIYIGADGDMLAFREMLDLLYSVIDPIGRRSFRLVGESARGSRELDVTYVSGLEGSDDAVSAGLSWAKVGLNVVAHQPFARARQDRVLEFRYQPSSEPFLGVVGGTDTPWPRTVTNTAVIGSGMPVIVGSEVPVYPNVELVGPMTSFHGDLTPSTTQPDAGVWSVDLPAGVASGSTYKMVTDPRAKSFRLNGALAAGRVALGSRLGPYYSGENILNVSAPGSTEATVIRLSWRDQFRALW